MGLLNKLGLAIGAHSPRNGAPQLPKAHTPPAQKNGIAAVGSHRAPDAPATTRVSNGLKEFLWNLDGLGRGTLLDCGPAWQTTLTFFIERGFRVTSEDLLRGWADFAAAQEPHRKAASTPEEFQEHSPEAKARRFLKESLQYPAESFDAVLLWDALDYMDPLLAKATVSQLTELLRPGGLVFAMFHSKKPEGFQRYRVVDTNTLQVLSSTPICAAQKVYQNREIQDLFNRYRSTKTFVGRDQLRETLFWK
jgi:hypothetical protein